MGNETITAKEYRKRFCNDRDDTKIKKPCRDTKKEKSPDGGMAWVDCVHVFTIKGVLPGMNEYINAERTNRFKAAKIKKDATNLVATVIWMDEDMRNKQYTKVFVEIHYYCPNKRKDKDNIAFAKKFIFDGMQKAGMIPNDGWDNIDGWKEIFAVDKNNPRIVIYVYSFSGKGK